MLKERSFGRFENFLARLKQKKIIIRRRRRKRKESKRIRRSVNDFVGLRNRRFFALTKDKKFNN